MEDQVVPHRSHPTVYIQCKVHIVMNNHFLVSYLYGNSCLIFTIKIPQQPSTAIIKEHNFFDPYFMLPTELK